MTKIECIIKECEARFIQQYSLEWEEGRFKNTKLRSYNLFKKKFGTEKYVKKCDKYVRSYMAQLRSGILPLNIDLRRHRQIEVDNRMCTWFEWGWGWISLYVAMPGLLVV